MPRYFFHLDNQIGLVADEEGQEWPDLESARVAAIDNIRSIMSEEARRGRIDLRGRVRILNEGGSEQARVRFEEAFTLIPADASWSTDS